MTKLEDEHETANLFNMASFFFSFVSIRLRNDLKINSSDILFLSSSRAILSEPIFE